MKKIALALCLLTSTGAFAQTTLVKEAEKTMKSAKTYAEYAQGLKQLEPAFTNPETANNAATYFGAAEIAFKKFDDMYGDKQFGKKIDEVAWFNYLMDAYNLSQKALAKDTVVNAKGKTEAKLSGKIAGKIGGHFNDFNNAGATFWEEKDFPKCYDAFTAYLDIPANPRYGKSAPAALPDSISSQINLFRAYAAMSGQMIPKALDAFDQMIALGGVEDPAGYDFAYNAAYQNDKDYDRMLKYTTQAVEKFGSKEPRFMEMLVNLHIDHQDYAQAKELLEKAIAGDPTNPGYYFSQGFLLQAMKDVEGAKTSFKKAIELNPQHARALLAYANILAEEFDTKDNAASEKMARAQYDQYFAKELVPILNEVVANCEAAYAADNDMTDALRVLRTAYYRLNDAKNLNRIEKMLL